MVEFGGIPVSRRRGREITTLPGWFINSRVRPGLKIPSQVEDLLHIEPLLCLEEDDMLGLVPNLDLQNFNPEPPIYALRFCPVPGFESILGLVNEDGNIAFQDINQSTPRMPLLGESAHKNAIFDFAWSPVDAKLMVTVSGDQKARLWDLGDGSLNRLREYRGYTRSLKCVEWKPMSRHEFATGARDNNIFLWDTRSPSDTNPENIIRCAHAHSTRRGAASASVTGLVWLDEYSLVSVGGNDGVIKVWDMRKNYSLYKNDPIPRQEIHHPGTSGNQGYTSILHTPHSCYIYVSCLDSKIYKYDIINAHQRPVNTYTGADIGNFFIKSSLSTCGTYLASGSCDNSVYIWNTNSPGGAVALLGPQEEAVTCVSWNFKENILAACTDDTRHRIWRPQRCTDTLRIRGRAKMTGVKPTLEYPSPVNPIPVTPSTGRIQRLPKTPTSQKSRLKVQTPSIKSFLTPKNSGSPFSNASSKSVMAGSSTGSKILEFSSPVNSGKRGKKRRLMEETEEEKYNSTQSDSIKKSINDLLLNPSSPVKCQFSPNTYRSPSKNFNSVFGCLEPRSPRLIQSPLKRTLLESPLRLAVRRPLENLQSPTANLPNYIKDGTSPLCVSHEKPARKADWLTQLSIEKQKSMPAKPERTKTPKSRKKIGYKS